MPYPKLTDPIPEKGKGSKLQPKMKLFVSEYMKDLNGAQAVLRAGYKTTNANRMAVELLNHPLVNREIEAMKQKRFEKNELSADYVIQKLISICDATETDNPQAALRSLELLGKHLGLYRDRQEISGPDGRAIEMEQRVKEDVSDFSSRMARLAEQAGAGTVSSFPKPGSGSGS